MNNEKQTISTNITDYTYAELLMILELQDHEGANQAMVEERADEYIERYVAEGNSKMAGFFMEIKAALLSYIQELDEVDPEDTKYIGPSAEQTRDWNSNIGMLANTDPKQTNKTTDRFQKIDVYNSSFPPMDREQLGVNNTHEVSVIQDGMLNPTLENTTQRIVVIDSLYRQESANGNISTDFTLDLSDKLASVLNMKLWSIQTPLTFYVIDEVYGNMCFWVTDTVNNQDIPVSVAPGNYSPEELVVAVTISLGDAGFVFSSPPVIYNSNTYKLSILLYDAIYTPPLGSPYTGFSINNVTDYELTFFNPNKQLVCQETCIPQAMHLNGSLGWLMGFHSETGKYPITAVTITAESVLDLSGPRYLILVVDDFTQNHFNDGIVTITEPSRIVKLPSYYTTDHPYTCVNEDGKLVPEYLQSAPRTLTQTQLYTINEIIKNNASNLDTRAKAPATTNVLAIIPVKQQNKGALFVEFSGPIQNNKRVYFGPVDIERMRVRLLDDKGNTLNLNGANWSFTLLCEMLYQY